MLAKFSQLFFNILYLLECNLEIRYPRYDITDIVDFLQRTFEQQHIFLLQTMGRSSRCSGRRQNAGLASWVERVGFPKNIGNPCLLFCWILRFMFYILWFFSPYQKALWDSDLFYLDLFGVS